MVIYRQIAVREATEYFTGTVCGDRNPLIDRGGSAETAEYRNCDSHVTEVYEMMAHDPASITETVEQAI